MKIFNFYKKNIGYIIKQNGPVKAFQTLRVRGQRNWLPLLKHHVSHLSPFWHRIPDRSRGGKEEFVGAHN